MMAGGYASCDHTPNAVICWKYVQLYSNVVVYYGVVVCYRPQSTYSVYAVHGKLYLLSVDRTARAHVPYSMQYSMWRGLSRRLPSLLKYSTTLGSTLYGIICNNCSSSTLYYYSACSAPLLHTMIQEEHGRLVVPAVLPDEELCVRRIAALLLFFWELQSSPSSSSPSEATADGKPQTKGSSSRWGAIRDGVASRRMNVQYRDNI